MSAGIGVFVEHWEGMQDQAHAGGIQERTAHVRRALHELARCSGGAFGQPRSWVAADAVRIEKASLPSTADVLQDEATRVESTSRFPMFGERFPA